MIFGIGHNLFRSSLLLFIQYSLSDNTAPLPPSSWFSQHGRMAMLGIVGLIVPEFVRVPGEIYQDVSVLDAHNAMVRKPVSLFEKLTQRRCSVVCIPGSCSGTTRWRP